MTNGEKLKEIFPNIVVNECAITIHATTKVECCSEKHCKGSISYDFWKEWWNSEYKEPTKALEQEPIIDKIRAEIEQYQSDAFYSDDVMMNKRTVLQILDKYKSLEQGTCKNCKYWQKSARTWGGLMYCALLSGEYMIDTEEDFYCADYKDRREE